MTDDEFIEKALANLKLGEKLYPKAVDRLIALARIGAAVQPRPISEAPRDGTVLLDTSGRRFIWGCIRGEYGFKWTDRDESETPWATTVGYFYYVDALPQVKPDIIRKETP